MQRWWPWTSTVHVLSMYRNPSFVQQASSTTQAFTTTVGVLCLAFEFKSSLQTSTVCSLFVKWKMAHGQLATPPRGHTKKSRMALQAKTSLHQQMFVLWFLTYFYNFEQIYSENRVPGRCGNWVIEYFVFLSEKLFNTQLSEVSVLLLPCIMSMS